MEVDGALGLGRDGGGPDLISALPEDLLLHVLGRLGCARAAARTSLLSRHWRSLWRRIAHFIFRDVALRSLLPALDSLLLANVFLLDVRVPEVAPEPSPLRDEHLVRVSSLLRAAADLSPVELRFEVPPPTITVHLPRFLRVTSINLNGLNLLFTELPAGKYMFPALETMSLSVCHVDLHAWVLQCPRLCVLKTIGCLHADEGITVSSASLRELIILGAGKSLGHIDFEVPALDRLVLSVHVGDDLSVSVFAPVVEKVLWNCAYHDDAVTGIGLWGLAGVTLNTESNVLRLCLSMSCLDSYSFRHTEHNLAQEIEKHLVVTDFSILDLHFETTGHAFGSCLFRLLRINWIGTATKILKIWLQTTQEKETCPVNCPCDEPKNWRSQTISLINLEEVEIKGFEGEDYEFDILRLIFKSAPVLKRMTVRLSDEVETSYDCCEKMYDIFKVHPLVECIVGAGLTNSS